MASTDERISERLRISFPPEVIEPHHIVDVWSNELAQNKYPAFYKQFSEMLEAGM